MSGLHCFRTIIEKPCLCEGSVDSLLDPAVGLNPSEMTQFLRIIDQQADRMRR